MNSEINSATYEPARDHTLCRQVEPEFISMREVAQRLRWSKRTVREKVRTGVFRRGEHFFEPSGCQPRWKWSAVVAWMESEGTGTMISNERIRG